MPPLFLSRRPLLLWTLSSLALLLLWDASGLDMLVAQGFGTAHGFALRDAWWFNSVLHQGARLLSWLLLLGLLLSLRWPFGVLRLLTQTQRLQWALSMLLLVVLISLMKRASQTSCPWDLAAFGGQALYVSHWSWGLRDGGGAHCFPAGHAAAGFVFVSGYFVLRRPAPHAARRCLGAALATGLLLGLAQQARGAHFMSHTLWTGWLCWSGAWLCDVVAQYGQGLAAAKTRKSGGLRTKQNKSK